jgi:hypothetical protein
VSADLAEKLHQRVNAALRSGRDDDKLWIGLGLEDVPGKPFQWAWNRERAAIRAHIMRKLGNNRTTKEAARFWNTHRGRGVEFAVTKIQNRLHRSHPNMRERQEAWKARSRPAAATNTAFTTDELAHLADHFAGANDPIAISIATKAATMLVSRK